ncbi:MAG: flagellar hook-basal body complex protein FliE [Defluviitaleaceae bacterium]|nr:flagellar hook-basal body complex protein FliE [Defluviitaleaceae bacterium]
MSAITAILDTTPHMAEIRPFAPNLQLIDIRGPESPSPFSAFFNAAINMVNDTNAIVAEHEQMQLDFATGKLDDILAVQMAQDRAGNAIQFTSQITNRIIESYREIMRMQI